MSHPAIKFCGLSHEEDIPALNAVMPEYVGLVFWPKSKRFVSAEHATVLREALDPAITTVGVFVDAPIEEVAGLIESDTIAIAQLHGREDDGYIAELRRRTPQAMIWKAFEVSSADDIARANASTADLVLLDGGKGEGNAFPWELLEQLERPFALAGGLSPKNVDAALEQCAPSIVDVSSGIEVRSATKNASDDGKGNGGRSDPSSNESLHATAPHKDPTAMADFASAVRQGKQK